MLPIADFSDSVDRAWDEFFLWLPRFVGFLVILMLGYIVAKFVGGLVVRALRRGDKAMILAGGA